MAVTGLTLSRAIERRPAAPTEEDRVLL
ncbi:hypothetical protein EMIT0324P_20425 [Pseudomonas chlororaphis]